MFSSPLFAENLSLSPIRIGVLAKRGFDLDHQKWIATADYLTRKIPNQHFEIVPLDFENILYATMSEDIDFLITNSSYYVTLESNHDLNRIATLVNLHGDVPQQVYGGVIFTRADRGDINGLQDVSGKTFWAVDRESLGGWLAAWREFHDQGVCPERDFRLLKFSRTHDSVVLAVLSGEADAGTVRSDTLERMATEGTVALSDVKILNRQSGNVGFSYLLSTRLYPEWPFAVLSHTPQKIVQQVANALLNMPASSRSAKQANIGGWQTPLDYRPIHELQQEFHLCLYEKHASQITPLNFLRVHWQGTTVLIIFFCVIAMVAIYKIYLNRQLEMKVEQRTKALFQEVAERKKTEEELRCHKENLEELVHERTADLDNAQLSLLNMVEDLNHANERLKEVDRLKSMFVATMSHELRTPLNSVIGFSSSLSDFSPKKC